MAGEINKRLQQLSSQLASDKLAQEAYRFFRGITPIRSGNAKSRTSLSGSDIQANYPYAQRLDIGYSKQAPRGMSTPTDEHIQKWIRKHSKG
jgi:hypothetical protein